jgi:hypothetical protein
MKCYSEPVYDENGLHGIAVYHRYSHRFVGFLMFDDERPEIKTSGVFKHYKCLGDCGIRQLDNGYMTKSNLPKYLHSFL